MIWPMLDRSAVGQLSSLSSRTKWQQLPAGDTLRSISRSRGRLLFQTGSSYISDVD